MYLHIGEEEVVFDDIVAIMDIEKLQLLIIQENS